MQLQGGTGKMGRGGGSAGKKTITTSSINRPASGGRLSVGGGGGGVRGRGGASSAAISSPTTGSLQVEESFSLVREKPLNFGIAIKLAPDLVEEIKRVEAQGATARIKFDVNANNPNGNVIHAGDKVFKFTWSREPGDLCDVYEEFGSGDDGNGLLLESGSTWRKLNVERELDDSTKNHVKRLSEEAERKQKSRKAIVLDHQNPSMKNHIKAAANVGSHPWRGLKSRKEPPFKKMKPEPPLGGPPLTFSKAGSSTTPISKVNLSSGSPLLSLQEQHGPQASPSSCAHVLRGNAGAAEVSSTKSTKKISGDNDTHIRPQSSNAGEQAKQNRSSEIKPPDLRGLMISLLLGNQDKGMTIQDLERALGEAAPNSTWQIEQTLKQIAVYHASGKYILKPGVEMEILNKQPYQSQSSPELSHHQALDFQKINSLSSQDPTSTTAAATKNEQKNVLRASPVVTEDMEKIDILSNSPEHSNEKKNSNNSDGTAGSSSDSRSGSESGDSSESESDSSSHSRSKSRSPQQSNSASSSDTTVSSKQASDEDVDIMTSDDDKESIHRLKDSGVASFKSPINIGDYGKPDGISDNAERQAANYLFRNGEDEEPVRILSTGECKRQLDDTMYDDKSHDRKRFKSRNSSHPVSGTLNFIFGESPSNSSPDSPVESPGKVATTMTDRNGTTDLTVQSGLNQRMPSSYTSDTQKGVHRSSEASVVTETSSRKRKPNTNDTSVPSVKHSEKVKSAARYQHGVGDKHSTLAGDVKETVSHASSHGRSPVMDVRHNALRREFSDLELGELRETVHDETSVGKAEFQSKVLSKQLETRSMDPGCQNSDLNRGKPYEKMTTDVGELSPRQPEADFSSNVDVASKRKAADNSADKIKASQSQNKQNQFSGDFVDFGTQNVKVTEMKIKTKYSDARSKGAATKTPANKVPVDSVEQLHDTVGATGSHVTKVSKKQKPGTVGQSNGKLRAPLMKGNNRGAQESNESPDEIASLFIKYEKEAPEMKGPITDVSQYENYVKEYQEKYESYSFLTRTLGSYRNEFNKLGKELEASKGRDAKRYHDKLEQMMSSYRECGERHKRMKKVFLLLHEELRHLKQMIRDFAASYKKK